MQKLLIITRHTPLPWEDGAGAYLHDVARFLAGHGFSVDVLWLAPHEHLRWAKIWRLPEMFSANVRLHLPDGFRLGRSFVFPNVVWLPFKAKAFDLVRRTLKRIGLNPARRANNDSSCAGSGEVQPWASPPTPAELETVTRFSKKLAPDVVMASYAWMCPVLALPALAAARHACLTHDIGWKRAALFAHVSSETINRDNESAWLRRAGLIIAISQSDAAELSLLAPGVPTVVAPKALEARAQLSEADGQRLIFVGSDNALNAEGLDWFLSEVWPRVLQEVPGVALDVCGSINRGVTRRPDGVAFHGPVASLADYYQQAAIVIIPLRHATGLNIKLVEAASFGRAIIATPVTMIGAPFLRDATVVAESPEEFAHAIKRLLSSRSLRVATATRGLAAARAHLAPSACYGPLAALLRQSV